MRVVAIVIFIILTVALVYLFIRIIYHNAMCNNKNYGCDKETKICSDPPRECFEW